MWISKVLVVDMGTFPRISYSFPVPLARFSIAQISHIMLAIDLGGHI